MTCPLSQIEVNFDISRTSSCIDRPTHTKVVKGLDARNTDDLVMRPARPGDGAAVFDITWQSVRGLATGHYSAEQIAGWMGERTPAFYEELIANGNMTVAEREGRIVGFVDSEPGEVTRLFILAEVSG